MPMSLQLPSTAGDSTPEPRVAVGRPHTTFYRLIPQARLPQRADRSAAGTLPMRAARYCDAVQQASAFGWWIFPPLSFSLMWDGDDLTWTWEGQEDWYPLASAAQFPDFAAAFDEVAPETAQGYSPPFLTKLMEPGHVQIWSGLIARTAPGWSLAVRPLANLPTAGGFSLYEGIIETDHWFGPLFVNLRLTRTGHPVQFDANFPMAQVHWLPRSVYADEAVNAVGMVEDLAELTEADWGDFIRTVVVPNQNQDRPFGAYAVKVRKQRKSGVGPHVPADEADPAAD
jgi:hypothetical protein